MAWNAQHNNNYTTNSLNSNYIYVVFYIMFSSSKTMFKFYIKKNLRYYFLITVVNKRKIEMVIIQLLLNQIENMNNIAF